MKELKEIRDDQIRIIGEKRAQRASSGRLSRRGWIVIGLILGLIIVGVAVLFLIQGGEPEPASELDAEEAAQYNMISQSALSEGKVPSVSEPVVADTISAATDTISAVADTIVPSYIETRDTVINDIPLTIFVPHNLELMLHVGKLDLSDSTVIFAAQAADVRADNGEIVGAFVLKGKPLSWGISKFGYCASINGRVTIGVAKNTPLFEQATTEGGYFFRQYPLVGNGILIENKPKGKSIRRAICERGGEIFMVMSGTQESYHDFAQALVDLGANQAISLVGSTAYGWAVDKEGVRHPFGNQDLYRNNGRNIRKNTSYIVWRKKGDMMK